MAFKELVCSRGRRSGPEKWVKTFALMCVHATIYDKEVQITDSCKVV